MFTLKNWMLTGFILTASWSAAVPSAIAGTPCGGGKVISVAVRWPEAPVSGDDPLLSIGIRFDDNREVFFSSQNKAQLDNSPWLRTVAQLATTAYLTGQKLWISTDNSNCNTFRNNSRDWVNNLGAVWLE